MVPCSMLQDSYICRQLRRKLERESHEFKEMILCLMEMIKDKDIEDHGTDEEWTKLIDFGMLKKKPTNFFVLLSMQSERF